MPAPRGAARLIAGRLEKVMPKAAPVAVALALIAPSLPGLAVAQGLTGSRDNAVEPARPAHVAPLSSFELMTPGNRMIARSLLWAQGEAAGNAVPASRAARWSLEDIAAARADSRTWGDVFDQMKADGLIAAHDLGEVVNGYYGPAPAASPVSVSSKRGQGPAVPSEAPGVTRMDSTTGPSLRTHEQ